MDKFENPFAEFEKFAPPFQWFEPGIIAVSWYPSKELYERYSKEQINILINCSDHDYQMYVPAGFKYHYIPIRDGDVPSMDQLIQFLGIIKPLDQQKTPFLIHCRMGCGRTGVLLIAWGYFTHRIGNDEDPVTWVRQRRLGCIETEIQDTYVHRLKKKVEELRPSIQ